jgi:hypothetical protein
LSGDWDAYRAGLAVGSVHRSQAKVLGEQFPFASVTLMGLPTVTPLVEIKLEYDADHVCREEWQAVRRDNGLGRPGDHRPESRQ